MKRGVDLLIRGLREARQGKGWTRGKLAEAIGVDEQTIKRMEAGVGKVSALVEAMRALDYHLSSLAKGGTLVEQLQNARVRMRLTVDEVASKAGISRNTVVEVEAGRGTIAPLVKILGVVGRRAWVAEPVRSSWSYDRNGDRDKRFTPRWFLDVIDEVWCAIDCDPCANVHSAVVAKRRILLDDGGDGLRDSWGPSRLVYVNPPFSSLASWITRAVDAYEAGEAETILMLCPVRTDSKAFTTRIPGRADVGLLTQRMKFEAPEGVSNFITPFALMVIVWGGTLDEIHRFDELCPATWIYRDRAGEAQSNRWHVTSAAPPFAITK